MTTVRTIDAHAAGEPLRLIVAGFPSPRGRSMADKRDWARRNADHLRRALMLEPRGHADMTGAVLTEPVSPGSDAGILFMHNAGWGAMCGHGIIAATTIALERGLLMVPGEGAVVYDTPAGTIRATAKTGATGATGAGESPRVERVAFVNVPSFVLFGGLEVRLPSRTIRADVAYGGEFYAIVDSESVGLPIDSRTMPELRRASVEIRRAIESAHAVQHPLDPAVKGIAGIVFTGPPDAPGADLRNVTVFADSAIDRSPCGAGTSAVMAVVDAMGLLGEDRPFVHEGPIGTTVTGRVASRTSVGEYPAIVPEIEGAAWITGEHAFVLDESDPLRDGFRI